MHFNSKLVNVLLTDSSCLILLETRINLTFDLTFAVMNWVPESNYKLYFINYTLCWNIVGWRHFASKFAMFPSSFEIFSIKVHFYRNQIVRITSNLQQYLKKLDKTGWMTNTAIIHDMTKSKHAFRHKNWCKNEIC